ncbi:MAG: L-aspartate oxidase [Verrucomicrobiota bacterium]|jgi:L-aspartate oxidase
MNRYDYVVIGSGIAGLSFALKAAAHGEVALITKGERSESNTAYAQGGIACVTSAEDSFELHVQDTLVAGAGLSDEAVARTIVSEGPARVRELVALGVQFDGRFTADSDLCKEPDLTQEGGHSKRRILHARDLTGREIERALVAALEEHPRIHVLEHHFAIDLITLSKLGFASEDRVLGVYVLNQKTGEVQTIRSERVVLATGGCGKVYLYTTNPDVATGDGVAMAWRAGARIANMEFIQFHPTCLYHPRARSFLISEAVRGEGARLVDEKGRPFMQRYDAREELAPRDIVARAIDAEMKRTGARCMYLDITHQSPEFIRERFPTIHETCLSFGIDITRERIPVVPAAHYQCGGVWTDVDGQTSIRGLYAIGEVACTGLHGANRLASNSLLEAVATAHRCHEVILQARQSDPLNGRNNLPLPEWTSGDAQDLDELVVIYHNWDEVRRLMWDYVGIVRTTKRLQRAATRLRNLEREIQEFYWNFKVNTDLLELRNLCTVASLIVDSALLRRESRGLHYTLDYPKPNEELRHTTILRRD